ncbi:MAG TPA: hypothetical protein VIU02_05270 [Burkholderiales bacterium]
MESRKIRGMVIAASAAVLFSSGCASPGKNGTSEATEAKVTCQGANACKGLSECHTANNQCAGQNACKGTGFVSLTPEDCKKATGQS